MARQFKRVSRTRRAQRLRNDRRPADDPEDLAGNADKDAKPGTGRRREEALKLAALHVKLPLPLRLLPVQLNH